ncbi:MAG: TrkH family potassium uptake protein [Candidatus Methanoplasma sp.]|jgi:trk system potassium uptake protein TrkH|nr:TrkH family potassium uptake protein [Candidatus Methanoplasma sp.]
MFATLRMRIKSLERWDGSLLKTLGLLELVFAATFLVPAAVALYYHEDSLPFFVPAPLLLACGAFQYLFFRRAETTVPASGVIMIIVGWLIAFIISSAPFLLSGFSLVDSLFEGISCFTTTGASVVTDFNATPRSLLLWRSLVEWAGGIAVVLMIVFIIPVMGLGGRAFLNNELSGSGNYNFSMRMRNAASNFIMIYLLLSAAEAMLLVICGLGPFDAASLTFSTISTGGMSVHSGGVAAMDFSVQFVVLVFMFLGGTNFYLHFRAIYRRDVGAYRRSNEFIWTIVWFLLAAAVVSVLLINSAGASPGGTAEKIWDAAFTTVSMGTTAGFGITDLSLWPSAAMIIVMILCMVGSMSGSTSGGVKIYRVLIVKSFITNGIYKMLHPRTVKEVRLDGYSVGGEAVTSAVVVLFLFIFTWAATTILVVLFEPDVSLLDAAAFASASLSTSGMGLGGAPFADLTDATKLLLMFVMWVGRVDIVIALCLFTRTFWEDVALGLKKGPRRDTRRLRRRS